MSSGLGSDLDLTRLVLRLRRRLPASSGSPSKPGKTLPVDVGFTDSGTDPWSDPKSDPEPNPEPDELADLEQPHPTAHTDAHPNTSNRGAYDHTDNGRARNQPDHRSAIACTYDKANRCHL